MSDTNPTGEINLKCAFQIIHNAFNEIENKLQPYETTRYLLKKIDTFEDLSEDKKKCLKAKYIASFLRIWNAEARVSEKDWFRASKDLIEFLSRLESVNLENFIASLDERIIGMYVMKHYDTKKGKEIYKFHFVGLIKTLHILYPAKFLLIDSDIFDYLAKTLNTDMRKRKNRELLTRFSSLTIEDNLKDSFNRLRKYFLIQNRLSSLKNAIYSEIGEQEYLSLRNKYGCFSEFPYSIYKLIDEYLFLRNNRKDLTGITLNDPTCFIQELKNYALTLSQNQQS